MKGIKGLTTFLEQIPDYRRAQGRRVPLPVFLTMVILGYMSGRFAMQEQARFLEANEEFFSELFGLSHGVPGYTQIRTILQSLDFEAINKAFYSWASQFMDTNNKEWAAIDGKGLNSTVTECGTSNQQFQAIVSVFVKAKGIVLTSGKYSNKKESEIHAVQELLKVLDQKGLILTLDALHCQKKLRRLSWQEEMTI